MSVDAMIFGLGAEMMAGALAIVAFVLHLAERARRKRHGRPLRRTPQGGAANAARRGLSRPRGTPRRRCSGAPDPTAP